MTDRWMEEFGAFLETPEERPPEGISRAIFSKVKSDLHPSWGRVLGKALGVHLVVGTGTLLVCPQFNFSPGRSEILFEFLMKYGHAACTAACGGFFLGTSALIAALVLTREEVGVLRKHRLVPWASLSIFSLLFFRLVGFVAFDLVLLAWLAGSIGVAVGSAELGWRLRTVVPRMSR
ncbi:MAG: hypothetical protein V1495_04675 [Pseudomonadota bacterium]